MRMICGRGRCLCQCGMPSSVVGSTWHRSGVTVALSIAASSALATTVPPADADLLRGAGIRGEVAASCSLSPTRGKPKTLALQVSTSSGGEYVIVERGSPPIVLARFQGKGELSCRTPQEARRLGATIARSETIRGSLRPRWNTTVVCGFTSSTEALCWQYSPRELRYTRIGGWST
jgi:hypothetical protein